MQDRVYSAFASKNQKSRYICKSEIDRSTLRNMGIPDFITIQEARKAFDLVLMSGNYLVIWTGSSINKNKRRRTQYISKYALYQEIIKGR